MTVLQVVGLVLVALAAALAALIPATAGAAARPKHRLHAFVSCSRFVHYARSHALA